jgi:hypothetical protein
MLAVLSPAKKLDFSEGWQKLLANPGTAPEFQKDTEILMDTTRALSRSDISRLMSLSESLSSLNYERFQAFAKTGTSGNAKPAVVAFRGDTYVGLDADSLEEADISYAQDHLRILSGLYGLLRPLDLIQPYRLEMGTRLNNPRGGNLYHFWGDRLTEALNRASRDSRSPAVVNLASSEYFKAVRPKNLKSRLITPVFREEKNGVSKVIGFTAKRARGMMARFMVKNRLTRVEDLRDFGEGGYRFQPQLSNDDMPVFVRRQS